MSDRDREYELEQELAAFDWNDIDNDPPNEGELVIATDGVARWMDMLMMPFWDEPGRGLRWQGHVATHWHAVRCIPERIKPKPQPKEEEIKF